MGLFKMAGATECNIPLYSELYQPVQKEMTGAEIKEYVLKRLTQ